jgi:hypothetical protein
VDGNDPHIGHGYTCVGDLAVFPGKKGEPLNSRDQTTVY